MTGVQTCALPISDTFGDDGLKRFDAGLGLGVAFEFGNIVVGVETGTYINEK